MRIKTKEDRRDRIKYRIRKRVRGTERAAAADRLPQRRAHLRAGGRRRQRPDDRVGVDGRAGGQGRARRTQSGGGNVGGAKAIGKTIAERLIEKGVKRVVFDRNGFLYHGRVKAVADAAREAGLEF